MFILTSASPTLLAGPVNIVRTNYHGWADSLRMSNGQVEVIVGPTIGRIMRLAFATAHDRSLTGSVHSRLTTALWLHPPTAHRFTVFPFSASQHLSVSAFTLCLFPCALCVAIYDPV